MVAGQVRSITWRRRCGESGSVVGGIGDWGAAHHLDLFFDNEGDTEGVRGARVREVEKIRRWVEGKKRKGRVGVSSGDGGMILENVS